MTSDEREDRAINVAMALFLVLLLVGLSVLVGWWLLLMVASILAFIAVLAGIGFIAYRLIYKTLEHFDGD